MVNCQVAHAQVDGPTITHMQAALTGLNGYKEEEDDDEENMKDKEVLGRSRGSQGALVLRYTVYMYEIVKNKLNIL